MPLKEEISHAIAAHASWKAKFKDFMAGKLELDAHVVRQNNQCQFGKWLEGEGKTSLDKADYEDIHRLHTEFHKIAADVIVKKKKGHVQGAEADLGFTGAFTKASAVLTRRMMDVK